MQALGLVGFRDHRIVFAVQTNALVGASRGPAGTPLGGPRHPDHTAIVAVHSIVVRGIHRAVTAYEQVADSYERGRPDYPHEAVATLVAGLGVGRTGRVLDLGAGTGKLTRRLVARYRTVVAVEPVSSFRRHLAVHLPDVLTVGGVAEHLPLADGSVDSVVIGQAFHWFSGTDAVAELHRVLVEGGSIGLIWNIRPADHPTHREVNEVLEPLRHRAPGYTSERWRDAFDATDLFGPLRVHSFSWTRVVDQATFVDRFGSVSVVAELGIAERAELVERIRRIFDRNSRDGQLTVPYETRVFTANAR